MSEARQQAVGKWCGILTRFGVDEKYLTGRNGPCPVCGGKDRWRWTNYRDEGRWICNNCGKGDGFDLLMKLHGWAFATAAKEVEEVLGVVKDDEQKPKADPSKRIESVMAGVEASHPQVTQYLKGRGLEVPPGIRAHRSVTYYDDGKPMGRYEAMVAAVQSPSGELASLHLTHLQNGGKAPVGEPRKMLTPQRRLDGAAIRLYRRDKHMGVAEGIETAIAAHQLFGIPVWSVVNTTLMEKWEAPEGVERVTIFADKDRNFAGEKAAYALAFKLVNAGISVNVRVPPEPGDWNDIVLNKRETAA